MIYFHNIVNHSESRLLFVGDFVVNTIDESQMPGGTGEEGSGDGEGHEMDGSNEDVSGTDYGGGESTIVQPNP